jgi:hypothetical protein
VKKALPKGSFVVVFGDTGMEFPDTYDVVDKTQKLCEQEEIPFYTAKSHIDPKQSWKLFGPRRGYSVGVAPSIKAPHRH